MSTLTVVKHAKKGVSILFKQHSRISYKINVCINWVVIYRLRTIVGNRWNLELVLSTLHVSNESKIHLGILIIT